MCEKKHQNKGPDLKNHSGLGTDPEGRIVWHLFFAADKRLETVPP